MLQRDRLSRIYQIAWPLVLAALATNLMTVIDTLMVGQLGDAALAGVGIGGQIFFLMLSLVLGVGAGVQTLVAFRVGEGRLSETGKLLNLGIVVALAVGAIVLSLAYVLSPILFGLMVGDPLVVSQGVDYLVMRLPSILFIGINIAFRSYWVGVSQAQWSMVSIVILSVANVIFNYILIFGHLGAPAMGVAGAGLGSSAATAVALLVNVLLALRLVRANGFLTGLPSRESAHKLAAIAVPDSLRQALFTVGVVLMYVLIGQLGTQEIAAFHVVISICLVAYMPHIGIGGAATTLVGEALGRRDMADANRWGWQSGGAGLGLLGLMSLGVAWFAHELLSFFLVNPETRALAVLPLQLAVFGHALDGFARVIGSALVGAGASKAAMQLTVFPQWLMLLPGLLLVVVLDGSLAEAMVVFLIFTLLSALLHAYVWQRGRWVESLSF